MACWCRAPGREGTGPSPRVLALQTLDQLVGVLLLRHRVGVMDEQGFERRIESQLARECGAQIELVYDTRSGLDP